MIRKRTSLDSLLGRPAPAEPPPAPAAPPRADPPAAGPARPRAGVKQQTLYLPGPVHEQLRRLAFEERVKMHGLLLEGLDRVFKDRGLKGLAELAEG